MLVGLINPKGLVSNSVQYAGSYSSPLRLFFIFMRRAEFDDLWYTTNTTQTFKKHMILPVRLLWYYWQLACLVCQNDQTSLEGHTWFDCNCVYAALCIPAPIISHRFAYPLRHSNFFSFWLNTGSDVGSALKRQSTLWSDIYRHNDFFLDVFFSVNLSLKLPATHRLTFSYSVAEL